MVQPTTVDEVIDAVAGSAGLNIHGGRSKQDMWREAPDLTALDMRGMAGIIDHDPDELIITVRAGTLLAEVEQVLAARGQMLAFEPFDHGPLFGRAAGASTIGGIVAANVSGSRRVSAGAARDHVLGFEAVSGQGEAFKGGGKVVKNVTGYDLPKLLAGSWGTLAVLTEITLRVLPAAKAEQTLLLSGLDEARAVAAMGQALSLPASVSGAALMDGVAALRIEGFAPSVVARIAALGRALAGFGPGTIIAGSESRDWWARLASFGWSDPTQPLWRVIVPPAAGADAGAALGGRRVYDWGGGLIWVEGPAAPDVAGIARSFGGHARPVRVNGPAVAAEGGGALAALNARVKLAFDPQGKLNPGINMAGAA
ncbi:FAD-binding protein [Novosphingobium sp. BL-52-GroH]|uniref:FAD-binding protein n=1 Tax=Novosphingobium sp. BL-52-GroH TaxID=3349877 RepID=UPI00384DC77C